jgi:hypothetical protein
MCLFCGALAASSPKQYLQETDHVKIFYYDPAHEYLVQHLIRCFETAYQADTKMFQYHPTEKVSILLEDFSDYGHGAATSVPRNHISIGLEPLPYTFETMPANERMRWLISHELIHVVMGDNAAGPDVLFRRLFGGKAVSNPDDPISILYSDITAPRQYSPRWFHEGIATFMETWLGGGVGRALGGHDEMTFRAMVRDEAYIYNVVGLESEGTAVDFQVGANAYLYGTRFMTHLVRQYGPDKLLKWVSRTKDSKAYFATEFKEVYGVPLQTEWDKWIEAERTWQTANLKRIREFPVTKTTPISDRVLGSVSRSYYDAKDNVVYAAVRNVGRMPHLAAIHVDTGKVDHLTDIKGTALYYVASMSFDPKGRRIFYTSDHYNWRDLNVYDLKTHTARRLMRDDRVGDLVYCAADDAIWGMQHNNGISSLVRIPAPFQKIEQVYSLQYGSDLFDIDISPDGRYLSGATADLSGRQTLVRADLGRLKQGDAAFETLHDFEYNTPGNFVFSPDGRYLHGSSYYTGASNLWRYDFASGKTDILTNTETGLFRPMLLPDGRTFAYEYNSKGFTPVFVDAKPLQDVNAIQYLGQDTVEKFPQLRQWKLPPPSDIKLESLHIKSGEYYPAKGVELTSIYPIVQGYKNTAGGGLRADFADREGYAEANVTASFSPDTSLPMNERFHVNFGARLWNLKVSGYYNNADFYDLFGPTKASRKGFALRVENSYNLVFDTPRRVDFTWGVAGYAGMDQLPDAQNVAVNYKRFLTGKLGLKSESFEKSLAAVDDEKGVAWSLNAKTVYTGPKAFPMVYGTYDRGILLPMRNSSLWFRASGGKVVGNPNDPFGNFYFGGFGNNWVDHQSISRYREFYSFPGVELDSIAAGNFGKGLVEWNAPPLRFKRLGTTAVYCNWARLSLFSSGLFTNLTSGSNRGIYGNFGAQVDFRIMLFTFLNSTFSTGYAVATDKNGRHSNEYMISLKIL